MTLAATYAIANVPMIFGDLLLSREGVPPATPVHIPAYGDAREFFGDSAGYTFDGLAQKIVVISDELVVGWSGSLLGARCAIARLRDAAKDHRLTREEIVSILENDPDLQMYPAEFVGWFDVGDGRLWQFTHQGHAFDAGELGEIHVAGSGGHVMENFATELDLKSYEGIPATVGLGGVAIAAASSIIGKLLLEELHGGDSAETLRHLFGGGYEVAGFFEKKFQKLGDTTFLFWRIKVSENGLVTQSNLQLPELVVKQDYLEDVLLIRSVRFDPHTCSQEQLRTIDEQAHAVQPMYECSTSASKIDVQRLSWNSRYTCHTFLIDAPHGLSVRNVVDHSPPGKFVNVKFEDLPPGQFSMRVRPDFGIRMGFLAQVAAHADGNLR